MDHRIGPRTGAAQVARARSRLRRQDRGLVVAGARCTRADGDAAAAGGGVMNIRPSRFALSETRRIDVSFEFFPPQTEEMEKILWESIERLAPLAPNFVSVTYGAGGSTRERTHATVKRILNETSLTPAAHLTCVAATREEVDTVVRGYHAAGVRHIVALRGDSLGGV